MALKEIHHEVGPHESGRIDRVVQSLTKLSRADVRGLFEHGCIFLNVAPCQDSGTQVSQGSKVSIKYDPHQRYKERARYRSSRFRTIHEDPYLLVVEKSAGILTVPTKRHEKENLMEAIKVYLLRSGAPRSHAAVVHRLDRDTSGLLVVGKNDHIAQKLKAQFEAHKPLREYLAIVSGTLAQARGTFRSILETDEDLNQRSISENTGGRKPHGKMGNKPPQQSRGKLAITHYEILETFRDATLVKVRLETGRRNQIRVHFSEAGHPVLGDSRYEPERARHRSWRYPRLALHAAKLGFTHPITGKNLFFESAPGIEFQEFLASHRTNKTAL